MAYIDDENKLDWKKLELNISNIDIEGASDKLNNDPKTLTDEEASWFIRECEFDIYQSNLDENCYKLVDTQGASLGDIEDEQFGSLHEIIDRLSGSYLIDYGFMEEKDDFNEFEYEIVSIEGELLISSPDINAVKEKFLSYINQTQEEYIKNGDKDEKEVNEFLDSYRDMFNDEKLFNDTLIDYGFEKLIKKEITNDCQKDIDLDEAIQLVNEKSNSIDIEKSNKSKLNIG